MATTLIATLGRSPGVVTGLYNTLIAETDYRPTTLHLLMTKHPDVMESALLIRQQLAQHRFPLDQASIIEHRFEELDFNRNKREVLAFQKITTLLLDDCHDAGDEILVGITGGRTGMGAMLAVSAQLYSSVRNMYHIWVDAKLEYDGNIVALNDLLRKGLVEEYEAALFPPADRRQLVWLPVYHLLQPVRTYIDTRTNRELEVSSSFDLDTINSVLKVLPGRMTIEQARKFLAILEKVQAGEDPLVYFDEIIVLLQDAEVTEIRTYLSDLKDFSKSDRDLDQLIEKWIDGPEHDRRYWARNLRQTYLAHREDIGLAANVFQAVLTLLAFHFQI